MIKSYSTSNKCVKHAYLKLKKKFSEPSNTMAAICNYLITTKRNLIRIILINVSIERFATYFNI